CLILRKPVYHGFRQLSTFFLWLPLYFTVVGRHPSSPAGRHLVVVWLGFAGRVLRSSRARLLIPSLRPLVSPTDPYSRSLAQLGHHRKRMSTGGTAGHLAPAISVRLVLLPH